MPLLQTPSSLAPPLRAALAIRGVRVGVMAVAPAVVVLGLVLLGDGVVAAFAAAALAGALGAALALRGPSPTPGPAEVVPADTAIPALEAIEALPDPLMLVEAGDADDLAGRRLIFANAAARDLLRIPREGALLVAAVRRPEVLEAVDESLFGRIHAATAFETGGAQDRFWRVLSRPVEAGPRRLALLVMHDETDARRNERMRADFLANASHELRTPLASITGFIETLRGHARDDADARDRFLHIMADQADRMRRLIEDLLSLSRIELNEHIPPVGDCDMALAVADVADGLTLIAGAKSVRIALDLPAKDEPVVVTGDRDQILQVLQNLFDNALKYSPSGGCVRVRVAGRLSLDQAQAWDAAPSPEWSRLPLLTPDRRDGELFVRVSVADSGPGIDRRFLPRLAERFYRVEGQKSGERLGTGLGLAIVKHIVNRHRGGLLVESAPGAGATFIAYFPMAAADPSAAVTKLS